MAIDESMTATETMAEALKLDPHGRDETVQAAVDRAYKREYGDGLREVRSTDLNVIQDAPPRTTDVGTQLASGVERVSVSDGLPPGDVEIDPAITNMVNSWGDTDEARAEKLESVFALGDKLLGDLSDEQRQALSDSVGGDEAALRLLKRLHDGDF